MVNRNEQDQAKQLRKEMEALESEKKAGSSMLTLPPRSRIHNRRSKSKWKKFKLSFPLIRLLLVLFLALIVAALTSPYWLP